MLQMDILARKIFLNLEIDQQKTILYRYKEPFQTLISGPNYGQISFGEGRLEILARLCMVVDWRIDHPEYTAKIKVIPKKDYPVLMPCEL